MGSGITIPGQVPNDGRIIGIPVRGLPTATLLQIQWNDTLKVFEFVAGGGGVSGDLAFLSKKEFDGNIVTNQVGRNGTTGDVASITAASGKDLYAAKAKVNMVYDGAGTSGTVIELKLNAVVKETFQFDGTVLSGTTPQPTNYEFVNIGQKVAATQTIKLEVILVGTGDHIESTIVCFIVDTGTDPTA